MPYRTTSLHATARNILLVDDNAHGLMARRTVLEELGHKIVTASNGADALELFSQHKFDLVVTDYKMSRMDGLELIKRLRKLTPHVPIVLVSGFVDALGLNEANTGADAVVQKSSNEVTHLLRAVARLAARKPPRKPPGAEGRAVKGKRKGG
jgi:CheY-like chemotaxis protein